MSVQKIVCPECKYELMYATLGNQGSYKTDSAFARVCTHAGEHQALDAMSCPALRTAAEVVLRSKFPGREISR